MQVVRAGQTTQIPHRRLKDARAHGIWSSGIIPLEVNGRDEVKDDTHNVDLLHDNRGTQTVDSCRSPAVARVGEGVVDWQQIIVWEGVGVVAIPGEAALFDHCVAAFLVRLGEGRLVVFRTTLSGIG